MSYCRSSSTLLLSLFLVLVMGCGSPNLSQRIAADRAAFEEWPPEVRELVETGKIEIGFTREQVRMAWGKPDNISMENTANGRFERWIYEKSSPGIGIGIGVGSVGRSSGVGGSVGTTVGGRSNIVALVRFQEGQVVSFEEARD